MKRLLAATLGLTLAAPLVAAAADFEGVIESRITMAGKEAEEKGSGTMRLLVGKAGSRMETEMKGPMGEMRMTMLHLKDKPKVTYMVNDASKTYREIEHHDDKAQGKEHKATVKKLGSGKVAGYDCVQVQVTDEDGEVTEVWTTKALGGAESFWRAMAGDDDKGGRRAQTAARALREAGADGWPLKWVTDRGGRGQQVTWEAVKVEKKSLPGAMFSLAGYTKSEHGAMGDVKFSPEQQKKMDEAMQRQKKSMEEAMKNMTPEQRKQMEEMMKKVQGGGK